MNGLVLDRRHDDRGKPLKKSRFEAHGDKDLAEGVSSPQGCQESVRMHVRLGLPNTYSTAEVRKNLTVFSQPSRALSILTVTDGLERPS